MATSGRRAANLKFLPRLREEERRWNECPLLEGTTICEIAPEKPQHHFLSWRVVARAPLDSVYAGGTFALRVDFSHDFPFKPPRVAWETPIWHCDIQPTAGGMCNCAFTVGNQWSPGIAMSTLLMDMLTSAWYDQNSVDPTNAEAAHQYNSDRSSFERKAKEWVHLHAGGSDELTKCAARQA